MKSWPARLLLVALVAALASSATAQTMDKMRDHRRILLIAAPGLDDPRTAAQRRLLAGWDKQAADRDLTLVVIAGARVTGAGDNGAALRARYRLNPALFQVLLIGKDGHVALRSPEPLAADKLQATIDAMPMRQAGER